MEQVTEAGQGLSGLLEAAVSHKRSLGAGHRRAVEDVEHLRERLASEGFTLAVLGQFKRGKSTFLNALLGIRILPTSVVPLTAIPTFVRWATLQNLDSAFRRFVSSLDSRLAAAIEAASGAVKAAVKNRREHADDILQEMERLLSSIRKLDDVRRQLLERTGGGTDPGTVREHDSLPADLRGSS